MKPGDSVLCKAVLAYAGLCTAVLGSYLMGAGGIQAVNAKQSSEVAKMLPAGFEVPTEPNHVIVVEKNGETLSVPADIENMPEYQQAMEDIEANLQSLKKIKMTKLPRA